jgi:hypothetical protein
MMRRFLVPGLARLLAVAFIMVLAIGISNEGTSARSATGSTTANNRSP